MATQTKSLGIVLVVLVAGVIAGCAAAGTVKKVTPADAALLPGTWQGNVYPPSGGGVTATMTVKPDGTYTITAAAFSSTGKLEIKDGYVQFMSTSGTGSLALGDRSGSAALMDRSTSWGLVGTGYSSIGGPFNYDFSKPK
jgi:hypothetical protein